MCPVLGLSHPGVSQSRSLPWSSRSHPQARHRRIWGCMQLWPDLCHKQRMRTTIAWDTGFGCQSPVSVPASANTSLLLLLKVTFSSSHSTTRTIWYQQGIQRHPSSIKTLHSSLHLIPSHPIPSPSDQASSPSLSLLGFPAPNKPEKMAPQSRILTALARTRFQQSAVRQIRDAGRKHYTTTGRQATSPTWDSPLRRVTGTLMM